MPLPEMEEERRGDPEACEVCFCVHNQEGHSCDSRILCVQ